MNLTIEVVEKALKMTGLPTPTLACQQIVEDAVASVELTDEEVENVNRQIEANLEARKEDHISRLVKRYAMRRQELERLLVRRDKPPDGGGVC